MRLVRHSRWLLVAVCVLPALSMGARGQESTDVERAFLEAARQELETSALEPEGQPWSMTDSKMNRQAGYNELASAVAATNMQERMSQPTPAPGHGYYGVPPYNLSTEPDAATTGIRLDTTYGLVRNVETATYFSKHQFSTLTGATIIPFQTPCWITGVRGMVGWVDNQSVYDDSIGYSIDAFGGTRYKKLYHKIGFLWDDFDRFKKAGVTYGLLTEVPVLGPTTVDWAVGWRTKGDAIDLADRQGVTQQASRVEQSDVDYQLRVGRFWCDAVQTGFTGNYYTFTHVHDEWGAGAFANIYIGRFQFSGDVTGGSEGVRGYVKLILNWGANPCDHPRDCNLLGADPVAWLSRAVERDQSIRLRQSYTGPVPTIP